MILVDTSVWIDHLHRADPTLMRLLDTDEVVTHLCVIGELACGSLAQRNVILTQLRSLPVVLEAGFEECLYLVESHRLYGQGLSWTDVQILVSARLSGAQVWTRDRILRKTATDLGVGYS